MKRPTLAILALLALSTPMPAEDSPARSDKAPAAVKAGEIARDYSHLTPMTKKAVQVDPGLAMLCVGVSQRDVEDAQKQSGPHGYTVVRIFMNEPAAEAFRKGSSVYPVGAVVVKEKHGLTYTSGKSNREPAKTHDGVGGMIKRDKGYDPEHGDWEYFYFEDASKIESGKISSCVQCHTGAAKTDHVFGAWAAAEKAED
jgi:hypothetical protein